MEKKHESVMVNEVLEALALKEDDVVVDATLGGAGHFREILSRLGADGIIVGVDADQAAVERARAIYAEDRRADKPVAHLVTDNFRNLSRILGRLPIGQIHKALFDLGWSGHQLTELKGFSFSADEPLLMQYGTEGMTAAEIVNTSSEEEVANLLHTYGEERFSRPIAKAIVERRKKERILTTGRLVEAVKAGTPAWYQKRKIHSATKTFQALRIAVNDEFGAIKEGLTAALAALAPGGRLAVITFHSLEDRLVKNILRDAEAAGTAGKARTPSRKEILGNRRARSAKLRVFQKHEALTAPSVPDEELLYCYV